MPSFRYGGRLSGTWWAYLVAAAIPVGLLGIRLVLGYAPDEWPVYLPFLAAILVSAYLGGIKPGLVATAVSAVLLDLYILPPTEGWPGLAGLLQPRWWLLIGGGALASVVLDALRRSSQRYRGVVESSLDAIVVIDRAGRIEEFSPAAERMFGHSAATVLGREMADVIVPPPFRERHRAGLARFLATGEARVMGRRIEMSALRADGTEFPVEISIHPGGTPAQPLFTGFIRDLTDQRKQEAALRESEERHRDLVENSNDLFCTHDLEGRILSVNEAALRLTGYDREQLLTMNLADLLTPEMRSTLAPYLRKFQTAERARGIMTIRTARGETRFWEYDNTLRRDGVTAPVVRGRARDITERRRGESALRESEERFRALFEQAAVGVAQIDTGTGKFVRINRRYCAIVGYDREEMLARDFQSITHPDDLGADLGNMRRLVAGEIREFSMEKRYLRKDGRQVWVLLTVSPMWSVGARPNFHIAVVEDITERKNLEEQFRHAQKMEAIGLLSGGVAHDFNNIVTVIKGRVSLLQQEGGLGARQTESLREIGEAAERAAALTRQLLAFSRRQVMQQRDLDLNELVRDMTTMLRRLLGEQVGMRLALAPAPLWTHADPRLLEQVLMNLAVNARDAMPQGGELGIETSAATVDEERARRWPQVQPGKFVRLRVSDTGTGIDPEVMGRIFEPFFTTKEIGKGTGLGLATAYGIVQQHRGGLEVESVPGRGSSFSVYLPLGSAPAPAPVAAEVPVDPPGGAETILLVEDEPAVQHVARLVLERKGYRVLVAATGREALAVWAGHRETIQLLLTDLMMPDGMNGIELARQLVADKPGLRVIYSSGYSASVAGKDFPLSESANFLAKPYEVEQLAAIVRRSLDTRSSADPFGRG